MCQGQGTGFPHRSPWIGKSSWVVTASRQGKARPVATQNGVECIQRRVLPGFIEDDQIEPNATEQEIGGNRQEAHREHEFDRLNGAPRFSYERADW